jgi:hypothetical protein
MLSAAAEAKKLDAEIWLCHLFSQCFSAKAHMRAANVKRSSRSQKNSMLKYGCVICFLNVFRRRLTCAQRMLSAAAEAKKFDAESVFTHLFFQYQSG